MQARNSPIPQTAEMQEDHKQAHPVIEKCLLKVMEPVPAYESYLERRDESPGSTYNYHRKDSPLGYCQAITSQS
jgi:hypothetical protein